ncbi:aldehyde dehydrogenase family protein [Blastococcus tunisiensis]|uniref:Acyl-CoA reductase n=1 Tax=Blastococcus tunisiensis TaxID=1798228 RepID=A0A1I2DYA6_9ACTN|nr:aldehyde dehydrogenase family protein [Blastococcus sp. DSM 46838]SFE85339.1 Acyl-CoA reductase [Blastococcus sp. DSM 46838]
MTQPITRPTLDPGRLLIGGEWVESTGGGRMDVVDPSTGQVATTVADATIEDVDRAVAAARTAYDTGEWARTSPRDRARVLHRVADLIREHAAELTAVESVDVGKPVSLCAAVDVNTAAETYEYYSALAQSIDGSVRPVGIPSHAYTRREALGVVAVVTPFNFPLILSSAKIAPALAAGNTVVHKPAPDTPLSALLMARILTEAGVPAGTVNVLTGASPEMAQALVAHPDVDKVTFTGSTAVGRSVAESAGRNLTPLTLELGGNAPQIVFDDADLEKAVGAAIKGFVFNTGQFCMGAPRLLVARPLHDTLVGILTDAVPGVPVGDPFDPGTVIGPMAAERHLQNVERYVAIAREDGGKVVAGGKRRESAGGFFYEPTVITGLPNESRAVQEEIFGPVVTVQAFDTEEEAVALANSTPYGLAAGLHTTNLARAHRVAAALKAGIVWINDWAMLDPALPFGGVGDSGYGRENGPEGLEAYTRSKSVIISLA